MIATGTNILAAHQLARQLKTSVAPHPFKDNSWRWGTVANVHLPQTGTLAHAANAGDKHILVNIPTSSSTPPVTKGAFVQVSSSMGTEIYQIASVAGHSGTYRLVLGRPSNIGTRGLVVNIPHPAGALVQVLRTVDVQMNGAVGAGAGSTKNIHYGVRHLTSYSPQVGDQVMVAHMQPSDWSVVAPLATPTVGFNNNLTAPLQLPAVSGGSLTTQGGNTLDDGSGNMKVNSIQTGFGTKFAGANLSTTTSKGYQVTAQNTQFQIPLSGGSSGGTATFEINAGGQGNQSVTMTVPANTTIVYTTPIIAPPWSWSISVTGTATVGTIVTTVY